MSSVADLLKVNVSEFKTPPRFPEGNYVMVISSYEMLPFSWKTSKTFGLAFVPKFHCVSCVEADDDSNPDLQAEQQAALDKFGDWINKEFEFAYTEKESQMRMAAVSQVNFPLIETDDSHEEAMGILEKHAWRFYLNEDDVEQGFVVDALGLSFPPGTPLGEVLEATVDQQFMAQIAYEPNQDPSRPPNLVIESVTCA
jgi:hypothetical protein